MLCNRHQYVFFTHFYWCTSKPGNKLPFARCVEASWYAIVDLRLPDAGAYMQNSSYCKASSHAVRCQQKLVSIGKYIVITAQSGLILVIVNFICFKLSHRGRKVHKSKKFHKN